MPVGRPPIPHGVREEVLARIAAGERLKHVCARPGMPHQTAVSQWVRQDPGFGQRYRAAVAKADHDRKCRYDPAKAAEVLRRLGEGERLQAILVGPHMPNRATVRIWRQDQPEFAEALFAAARERRALRAHWARQRLHRPFDQRLADRAVARVAEGASPRCLKRIDPALPGARLVERWRREDSEFAESLRLALNVANRRRQRRRLCHEEVIDAVTDRVFEGETLAAIGADPAMPCAATLYAWLRKRPDFYRAMEAALRARADMLADELLDLSEAGGPHAAKAVARLKAKVRRLDRRAGEVGPR